MKKTVLTLKKESAPANTNEASINMVIADKDFMKALGVTPEDVIKQVKISEKEFKEVSDYVASYKGTFAELYKELKGWNLGYANPEQDENNLFDCYYKSLLITVWVDEGVLKVSPNNVYVYPINITKVDSDELFHLDFDKPIDYSKINTKVTESIKSVGRKILKKESIQSTADWVTKAKKIMSDIKANKVDYNFYEITSDLEEEIERTDDRSEKELLTGLLHTLNNAYSKIVDKEDKDNVREDKELLVEDDLVGMKKYAEKLKWYLNKFTDNDNANDTKTIKQKELDSIIETLWRALEDVPFVENEDSELILDGEYLDFPKGTERETIWHWFDGMYSKGVSYLLYNLDENKNVTEAFEEDLDEAFYEKICRAYIDTVNLEWVTTNPENYDSVVHGYFPDDETASKWEYGDKVTPENFKDVAYDGLTQEEIDNLVSTMSNETEWYEYETWEDFYEDYIKDEIKYDINDIGVYSDGSTDYDEGVNHWDFYISEEDLTKLGLWNEDMKSEFLDESKKVTENNEDVFSNLMKEIADLPDAGLDYKGICATIVGDMAGMAGLENNAEAMAKVNIETVREIADAVFEEDSIWEPIDDFIYSSIYGRLGIDY